MPEIQDTVPRNQDQSICCYRPMPETRTKSLVSGLKYLKSRQMCTEVMASEPEKIG